MTFGGAAANPYLEEPDAGDLHVRICGGPGRVTAQVYPTSAISNSVDRAYNILRAVKGGGRSHHLGDTPSATGGWER